LILARSLFVAKCYCEVMPALNAITQTQNPFIFDWCYFSRVIASKSIQRCNPYVKVHSSICWKRTFLREIYILIGISSLSNLKNTGPEIQFPFPWNVYDIVYQPLILRYLWSFVFHFPSTCFRLFRYKSWVLLFKVHGHVSATFQGVFNYFFIVFFYFNLGFVLTSMINKVSKYKSYVGYIFFLADQTNYTCIFALDTI
jgi:hypothetical protein